jgi:hypothetical protein
MWYIPVRACEYFCVCEREREKEKETKNKKKEKEETEREIKIKNRGNTDLAEYQLPIMAFQVHDFARVQETRE